jgi:hypothetical protein
MAGTLKLAARFTRKDKRCVHGDGERVQLDPGVCPGIGMRRLAEDNLAAASPDLLRAMVKTFADALMSAEASGSY